MTTTTADAGSSLDLLSDLLAKAKRAGADAADALLIEGVSQSAQRRMGKLEEVERAERRDLGLRVLIGRRQAVVSTGDLAPASLERLAERAVTIARSVPEDRFAGLAEPDEIATSIPDLELDDGGELSSERLEELAAEAEDAALAEPKITNSEGGSARWSRTRVSLAATNGFAGSYSRSGYGLSVVAIASANGGGMERDYEFASVLRADDLPDPATVGRCAAERAARRLGARKVASKAVPVVYDPRVAGGVIRHLAGAISGPTVARGTTFLKDSLHKKVFADGITIVDDPLRPWGLRSTPFDADGIAPERLELVRDGVLTTWLLDCGSARQLNLRTTGRAARDVSSAPFPSLTNAWIEPGRVTPEELMADIKEGFYVTEMLGMGLNIVTGDYSRGAAGFWIENGELAFPVSEMTVAGKLQTVFERLTAANDLELRYGVAAPTLRIDGLFVGGR